MSTQVVAAYVVGNTIVAGFLGVWIYEPLRLALKEMPRRQVAIWCAIMVAAGALFLWMAR